MTGWIYSYLMQELLSLLVEPRQSQIIPYLFIAGTSSCYQYQLQSMWQKCWNQNANLAAASAAGGGNGTGVYWVMF